MKRMPHLMPFLLSLCLLFASWPMATYAQPVTDEPVVQPDFGPTTIGWNVAQVKAGFVLVVSGPDGYRWEQSFPAGAQPAFQAVDATGAPLADGLYKYDLRPLVTRPDRSSISAESGRDPSAVRELVESQGESALNPVALSGAFTVADGAIVDPTAAEEGSAASDNSPAAVDAPADQVINDDLIVTSSICVGFDCVNGESFGFDTLRLKENNLRIKFQDTSTGSFPSRDWQITANDSASGGANKFSIDDIDGGRTPFTIEADARTNALYVESDGDVGFGTNNPVVNLHMVDGNTPTMRLEQDGSSGFNTQTWDVAGNETNFFIRDTTNGSRLPFKIFPNAATNSLTIEGSTGDIGLGTTSPTASLHVRRTDGTAQILVEEASGTSATRTLMELKNSGKIFLTLNDTRAANTVDFANNNGGLNIRIGGANNFVQTTSGDVTIGGNLTVSGAGGCTGCRDAVQTWSMTQAELLASLSAVSIMRWDGTGVDLSNADKTSSLEYPVVSHLTPEMQAFYDAYGLGLNGEQIAPLDVATVSLASVQALHETIVMQQQLLDAQAAQIAVLEARLERVESMAHGHTYLPSVNR